ncbi:MAG: hypothetical protein M3P70_13260 [Actinomycetota bacterium]|nr:hypothetical protein [Actinomycetota bacterium]
MRRVADNAGRVPGVSKVEFQGGRFIVTYDPSRTDPQKIVTGIESSGVDEVSKIEPLDEK